MGCGLRLLLLFGLLVRCKVRVMFEQILGGTYPPRIGISSACTSFLGQSLFLVAILCGILVSVTICIVRNVHASFEWLCRWHLSKVTFALLFMLFPGPRALYK